MPWQSRAACADVSTAPRHGLVRPPSPPPAELAACADVSPHLPDRFVVRGRCPTVCCCCCVIAPACVRSSPPQHFKYNPGHPIEGVSAEDMASTWHTFLKSMAGLSAADAMKMYDETDVSDADGGAAAVTARRGSTRECAQRLRARLVLQQTVAAGAVFAINIPGPVAVVVGPPSPFAGCSRAPFGGYAVGARRRPCPHAARCHRLDRSVRVARAPTVARTPVPTRPSSTRRAVVVSTDRARICASSCHIMSHRVTSCHIMPDRARLHALARRVPALCVVRHVGGRRRRQWWLRAVVDVRARRQRLPRPHCDSYSSWLGCPILMCHVIFRSVLVGSTWPVQLAVVFALPVTLQCVFVRSSSSALVNVVGSVGARRLPLLGGEGGGRTGHRRVRAATAAPLASHTARCARDIILLSTRLRAISTALLHL